jgi:2-phosphosulfolactate phosphatase
VTVRRVDRLEEVPSPTPDADFVVVDVIMASTAIVRLLEEGAEYVRPFGTVDEALDFAERTEDVVLVGEQAGAPVDGFDLLPLPSSFSDHDLDGARVGMVTTNGTRAVERIGAHEDIFVASTVNARAVADALAERDRETWLVAAGRYGEPTPEDTAGARLVEAHHNGGVDDEDADEVREAVRSSNTADWIRRIGLADELDGILELDSSDTVPRTRDGVFVDTSRQSP